MDLSRSEKGSRAGKFPWEGDKGDRGGSRQMLSSVIFMVKRTKVKL